MDSKDCMISLAFSGCYVFKSTREIDPARSGMFYIDGSPTEKPVLVVDAMFGQLVCVCVRKYLHRYDATYRIRYTGAFDIAGRETLVQGSSLYSQWNPDKIQVHLFTERRRYEIRTADK